MKKTDIVLFCLIIGFVWGCKKQPIEPETVSSPQVKTQSNPESKTTSNFETSKAVVTESVSAPKTQSNPAISDLAWMTDFEAAKKKAAAEGKDLFINFTGSDWCVWCQRLDREVFRQNIFIYMAQQHFVFVMVDFPRNKKQSNELKEQNEKLAQKYDARAFPTIVLALSDGTPYAQTGYQQGGPLAYMEELARLQLQKPAK